MKITKFKTEIKRNTHQLDATNQSVGRLATQIAYLLRGKNKASFTPNVDNGDFVEILNLDKLKFTGNKLEQKKYYQYSGYPGGLKEKKLAELLKTNPQEIVKNAVYKMLPKNKLRPKMIKRLTFK